MHHHPKYYKVQQAFLIKKLTAWYDEDDCLCTVLTGAPNDNFRENICSEDDLRARIFGKFVVKFLACLLLLGFSNIQNMV